MTKSIKILRIALFTLIAVCFLAFLKSQLPFIQIKLTHFLKNHGNYNFIRNQSYLVESIKQDHQVIRFTTSTAGFYEAAQLIPEDSSIEIIPDNWGLSKVLARYTLFPRRIVDQEDPTSAEGSGLYSYDFYPNEQSFARPGQHIRLPSGALITAQPKTDFHQTPPPHIMPWWGCLLLVLATSLFQIIFGLMVLSRVELPITVTGRAWHLSTAYLLGLFLLNGASWIATMLGLPFNQLSLAAIWIGVFCVLYIFSRNRLPEHLKTLAPQPQPVSLQTRIGSTILWAGGFILLLPIITSAIMDWDGMLHWAYLAKLLYQNQTITFHYPDLSYYPMLWPFQLGSHLVLQNMLYDGVLSLLVAVNFLVFWCQMAGCLRILAFPRKWIFVPLFLMMLFFYHENTIFLFSYADVLMMNFSFALCGILLINLHNKNLTPCLPLIFLLSCALTLTKLEGAATTLILGAAFLARRHKRTSTRQQLLTAACFGSSLLTIIGWILWVKWKGFLIPISHLENPVTWGKLNLFGQMLYAHAAQLNLRQAGFVALLLIGFLLRSKPVKPETRFLFWVFLGLAAFSLIGVMGVHPHRMEEMLQRATPRLFLHAVPFLILWWAGALSDERERLG